MQTETVCKRQQKSLIRPLLPVPDGAGSAHQPQRKESGPLRDPLSHFVPSCYGLGLSQRLRQVFQKVVDIFQTDGQADHAGRDASFRELLVTELAMRGAGRMQDTGTDIGHMHFVGGKL